MDISRPIYGNRVVLEVLIHRSRVSESVTGTSVFLSYAQKARNTSILPFQGEPSGDGFNGLGLSGRFGLTG